MATIVGLVFPEEKKKGGQKGGQKGDRKDGQKGDKEHEGPDEAQAAAGQGG